MNSSKNTLPKNTLPKNTVQFYEELSEYLDTKIHFYGSVQRSDYFPNHSDIDVDIFTDNERSTIEKMKHFLHIGKQKVKKVVWKLRNNRIIIGHKIKYVDKNTQFRTEFSIYNEKFKEDVLRNHMEKTIIPYYATILLMIIKFLYYKVELLNKSIFLYLKRKILSTGLGLPEEDFIVLETDNRPK